MGAKPKTGTARQRKRRLRRTARRTEAAPNYSYWAGDCSGSGCPCCDPGMLAPKSYNVVGRPLDWYDRRDRYLTTRDAKRAVRCGNVVLFESFPSEEYAP